MKRFSEQFHKKAESVKLRAAERRALRERIVSYMEYHPLPAAHKEQGSQIVTEVYKTITIPFARVAQIGAAFAVLVLIVVPFMAERSVPGDGLYAVKVRFNEQVRGTLALDPYQKVEWETERLNRRIAEAKLLASEGKLSEETEAQVADAVREQTKKAKESIEALRTEDADEATLASIELDTTLEVQSAALKDDEESIAMTATIASATDTTENATDFLVSVLDESRGTTNVNATATIPAYEKIMARVEVNTTRAHELIASLNDDLKVHETTNIERRLEDIERTILEAIQLHETDDIAARKLLVDALQRTQKLIVFMTELKVSTEIDLEKIVPLVLTEEEKVIERNNLFTTIEAKITELEVVLEDVDLEDEIAEKVQLSLEQLVTAEAELSAELPFGEFKQSAKEIIALADDTLALIRNSIESEVTNEFLIEDAPVEQTPTSTSSSTTDVVEPEVEEGAGTTTASTTVELGIDGEIGFEPEINIPQL